MLEEQLGGKLSRLNDGHVAASGSPLRIRSKTPFQAPIANAYAERSVRSIREECPSRRILFDAGRIVGGTRVRTVAPPPRRRSPAESIQAREDRGRRAVKRSLSIQDALSDRGDSTPGESMKLHLVVSALALVALSASPPSERGVGKGEIVLGQSCALTGPAAALGTGMRAGLEACFAQEGPVDGRRIRLVTLDDGYEPDRAIKNTRRLIEQEEVFLLIGEVGTPTSKAVVPIAEEEGVPFFGPFTGAEFLRAPDKQLIVNVRGSYYQEMERHAQYLVDKLGLTRIACFYQNDGYGQAGLEGIELALTKRDMALVSTGTYERNTAAVKGGLLRVRKGNPEAVIMVGAYKPCAAFIKAAKKIGMDDILYCNISFVGTEALRSELGDAGEGVIISQVVRYPWDGKVPLVAEYLAAMKKHRPEAEVGFVSLEGYTVGKLFCAALERVDGELTRERFLETINEVKKFDLGGVKLEFGARDRQGMDEVYMTIIRDGVVVPMEI